MTAVDSLLTDALRDRYVIEREVGRGGMATVYLAEDLRHRRQVAIKVLDPELGRALGPDRFLREIEIAAQLQHPHILSLLDSGEAAGMLYYVMPYVPGESLRSRLARERQLPLDEVLTIAGQIGAGLAYAHERGVVHRDIKPENILLEEDQAVLADFGIALALSSAGRQRLTETGLTLGTPAYMSPEQAAGDRQLDSRSDIYSFACVVYEMLAGEPPFTGPTAQAVMARHSLDPVPRIRTVRNTVPEAVEQVVRRALAKSPADRYRSARHFVDALAAAHTQTAHTEAVPAERSRPAKSFAVSLGLAAAMVLVALGAWWTLSRVSLNSTARSSAEVGSTTRRVAVLSFTNLSSDTTDAYLGRGVSEEIASRLGDLPSISVAGRSTVDRLERADPRELPKHARALNLRYVVEGSVRRAGPRLRVSVRLVNPAEGFHAWSQSYDRAAADMLDLEDQIAADVARAVVGDLVPADLVARRTRPTSSPAAYDRLLRGNHYLAQRNPRSLERAIELYAEAAALDSTFSLALARLAYTYGLLLDFGWSYEGLPPESLLAQGWKAVERAIRLDTTTAEVWQARGLLLMHRHPSTFAGARKALARAVELDPRNAEAHHEYGHSLRLLGNPAAAAVQFHQALASEPDRPMSLLHLGWIDMQGRRYEAARRWLDSAISVHPGFYQAYAERGALRMIRGDTGGARADAETAVRLRPRGDVLSGENILLALDRLSGDSAAMRSRLTRLQAYAPRPDALGVHRTAAWAAILVAAGEEPKAIDFLDRVPSPSAHLRIHLEEVHFNPVRSNPQFQRLLSRMRIAEPG